MPAHSLLRRSGALACCLLLAAALGAGAAGPERGFPLIQTYLPPAEVAETQNFGVARDARGLLYFANAGGIVVYDGAWWRHIPVGKGGLAASVASDGQGRIAVGGSDELGILTPDAQGTLRFSSLLGLLPPAERELGQVMSVHDTGNGFAFLTTRSLLVWDGSRMTTVARFPGDRPYATSFKVGTELYVWTREGLTRLAGGRLAPVPGGEVFAGRRLDMILPAERGLLVSVREGGLFLFMDGKAAPFAPAASQWTAAKRLFPGAGCRLPDGRWAVGSLLGGLLLLRPDGGIDQVIDSSVGLPDDFVNGLALDREGALWLALNNGMARVEVGSPLSVIDRRAGLQGSVYAVARHRGDLWVGSSAGLFTRDPGQLEDRPLAMRPVPGLPPSVWSLLSTGDDLLVGTAYGLYQMRGASAAPVPVPGTPQVTIYALARAAADPERVWVGTENGLAAVRRTGTGWRWEGAAPGPPREIRTIVDGLGGVVWCGTTLDGVVGYEILHVEAPAAARVFRELRVAGSASAAVVRIGGRILVANGDRVLRLAESRGTLVEDRAFAGLRGTSFATDREGNLWMNSRPLSVALRRGSGWVEHRSMTELPARTVETIVAEPDGVVWLGAENGLFRYAGSVRGAAAPLPAPLFARVTMGRGTLLFGGAPGTAPPGAELPPNLRHLRVEIGPLSFRAGLRYQTRLDPVDADWSPPSAEPFAELTRLWPGDYTLRVRTKGASGEVGPEAAWSFRVLPPWYEAPWAIGLWIAAAALLVIGYSRLRSRALRQRAARLEARVAEQTLELRRTVDELSRAHAELEVANEQLEELSLQDDLTGIANRRRLQSVLQDEWKRARRYQRPLGFILLDLDHFKKLNDTRGHREGDLCLQAVAHYLADTLRRTSDLVARYGGEEFAVLLPDTGLPGALRVAEQLRAGIEALALAHEAAPAGRVTASFGVATLIPDASQTPDLLVEAADVALYSAKTAGRNRVEAGTVEERGESRAAL
jgi:diguanylate cyclase (GGDEF)-like protein